MDYAGELVSWIMLGNWSRGLCWGTGLVDYAGEPVTIVSGNRIHGLCHGTRLNSVIFVLSVRKVFTLPHVKYKRFFNC